MTYYARVPLALEKKSFSFVFSSRCDRRADQLGYEDAPENISLAFFFHSENFLLEAIATGEETSI